MPDDGKTAPSGPTGLRVPGGALWYPAPSTASRRLNGRSYSIQWGFGIVVVVMVRVREWEWVLQQQQQQQQQQQNSDANGCVLTIYVFQPVQISGLGGSGFRRQNLCFSILKLTSGNRSNKELRNYLSQKQVSFRDGGLQGSLSRVLLRDSI